jgi:hypothetical protein
MGGFNGTVTQTQILASSGARIALPDDTLTTEQAFATITIPPLKANSILKITVLGTGTGINIKTFRVRFGTITGSVIHTYAMTTNLTYADQRILSNRGVTNSQVCQNGTMSSFSSSAGALTTSSVDTSVATTLVLTGQLSAGAAAATEKMYNESYLVEIINP